MITCPKCGSFSIATDMRIAEHVYYRLVEVTDACTCYTCNTRLRVTRTWRLSEPDEITIKEDF